MTQYLVIRHGSNTANQPMLDRAVLGFVDAKNKAEALETAAARFTSYYNQRFEIQDAEEASIENWDEAAEVPNY